MTIRSDNWCTACMEACHDHPSICTVCGTPLTAPPAARTPNARAASAATVRLVPDALSDELRLAGRELRGILAGNIAAVARGGGIRSINDDDWQAVPLEALDPQASAANSGRPTSKKALEQIPRIVVDDTSSFFHQVTVDVFNQSSSQPYFNCKATLGEFGPRTIADKPLPLSICEPPRTGKGGIVTKSKKPNPIVLMERGDGLTFAKKAALAQQTVGASAVIIANTVQAPWPYVMKDSKGEAKSLDLKIPTVMIQHGDGKRILEHQHQNDSLSCRIRIKPLSKDCAVCRDELQVSQTILQLPGCGHIFHEVCAVAWLTKHNTCPYCRLELPTDDEEYENERRRTRRTHAGGAGEASSEWNDFYG